jgi:predicted TPR repeat methyltransferase
MSDSSYVDSHKDPAKGRQYDAYYASDPWARYLWSREQEVLAQALELYFGQRSVRALDFACGTGRICGFLETRVASCTGVDVSEAMLGQARVKLQRTVLHKANLLEQNPFEKESFDLITAFRFFVNAEPELRRAALRALAPLLAPDGCLIFNNHQNLNAPYMRVTRAYAGWRGFQAFNVLSIAECRALVAEVGLEIVHVFPVGMFRLPKLNLPSALYRVADRLAGAADFTARWSMSPILVARRKP